MPEFSARSHNTLRYVKSARNISNEWSKNKTERRRWRKRKGKREAERKRENGIDRIGMRFWFGNRTRVTKEKLGHGELTW